MPAAAAPKNSIARIKDTARGRWVEILGKLGGIAESYLDPSREHPCPKCGGETRFRVVELAEGACFCNHCFNHSNGDGVSALSWINDWELPETLDRLSDYLGMTEAEKPKSVDPAKNLAFEEWNAKNSSMLEKFCLSKEPIIPDAIQRVGGRPAVYYKKYSVIAIPVWGRLLAKTAPVGWCLYNLAGGTLPKDIRKPDEEQTKIKITFSSEPGIITDPSRLATATELFKLEGVSDLLAFLSLPDLPAHVSAVSNSNGAQQNPQSWMIDLFKDKLGRVIHDQDVPGRTGALGLQASRPGAKEKIGWAEAIAAKAIECKHIELPFKLVEKHGADLRDYLVGMAEEAGDR